MSAQHPMDRHNPRRNDALGLVRREVTAGRFSKGQLERWKKELGSDVVDGIVEQLAPAKAAKTAGSKKADPDKE